MQLLCYRDEKDVEFEESNDEWSLGLFYGRKIYTFNFTYILEKKERKTPQNKTVLEKQPIIVSKHNVTILYSVNASRRNHAIQSN